MSETQGQGNGAGAGQGAGGSQQDPAGSEQQQQQQQQQTGAGQQGAAGAGTGTETVSKAEHDKELDKYRNQVGQTKKQLDEALARLKQLEDAGKTEAEKLAEKAKAAEVLQPRVERLEAAVKTQLDTLKAALPAEVLALMPEGDVADQLLWTQKAVAAAAKLAGNGNGLPPAGGRNPAGGTEQAADKLKFDQALTQFPTLQGRRRVSG
jgi:hypothetical protein